MATPQAKHTSSVWFPVEGMPDAGRLIDDTSADVCVVGAGIAGLTTAYLLAKEGKSVVVVEASEIGGGETGRTTAHLASALDDRFTELERLFGQEGARLAAESHAAAIDRIEAIVRDNAIDCDFQRLDGFLFGPPNGDEKELQREFEAARRAGLPGVQVLHRAPIAYDTGPCLRFPRQGQFHPMKYLAGVGRALRKHGGRIFIDSFVNQFQGGQRTRIVTREGAKVEADALVVATNTPMNDRVTMHTKQAAYRTYAVAFSVAADRIHHALYWDMEEPYHYVRLQKYDGGELLIVGGEDHKTGQDDDPRPRLARLEEWTRTRFPQAGGVAGHWSGQVLEPVDSLGFIGRNPGDEPNVFIVTGDSGHGMTHGTIAGMLLTDLILNRDNPWAKLYDPSRKSLRATGEFLKENLNVAGKYLEWLGPGEVKSADELKPGEGALIRHGLTKRAVFRDDKGQVSELSAVCPHLGCFVHFNAVEKTWDCPCHGSRFDVNGQVLNGPAAGNLSSVDGDT